MSMQLMMDKAGRIVLPKEVRVKLHLMPGDLLEVEVVADGIHLSPRRSAPAQILREGGRPVWNAPGASASLDEIDQALERGRRERDARASGV